ncbi:hypothetical protein GCM10017688_33780 [Streptomyces ramulosus]
MPATCMALSLPHRPGVARRAGFRRGPFRFRSRSFRRRGGTGATVPAAAVFPYGSARPFTVA